jgi:hypothetical protein
MLVFHAHCQMGNQMFIYACARSLAKKRNLNYCLSEISHLKYFKLAHTDKYNQFKFLSFKLQNKISGLTYKFEHFQDNRKDYSEMMSKDASTRIWYYGYFQGEAYLYKNFKDIKQCFEIKEEYQQAFKLFYKTNFNNKRLVIAHIRLKDYKTFGPDFLNGPNLSLPFSYYHTNIKKIIAEQPDKNYQLVFMSDDMAEVKKEFIDYDAYFSEQSMIIDFQLLQHAHVAVISSSSYAWWACWLSKINKPIIIVPKYFLGFKVKKEFPINMIPQHFTQSEVYELK